MAAVAILFAACWGCASANTVTLLTRQDVEGSIAQGQEENGSQTVCESETCYNVPMSFSVIETKFSTGPEIKVVEPAPDGEYRAPIKLIIDFIPRPGTQVDLKTFRLEYLKFVSVDITGRVAGYVGPTGVRVEKADLPPGDHKLRITLKDTAGGISQMVYLVKILK